MTCLPSGSQDAGELFGLRPRDGLERRFVLVVVPDSLVVARLAPRPDRQDDAVEDELPEQPALLDHARIGEELFQVAAHRLGIGRVGRAEIDQQHADTVLHLFRCRGRFRCYAGFRRCGGIRWRRGTFGNGRRFGRSFSARDCSRFLARQFGRRRFCRCFASGFGFANGFGSGLHVAHSTRILHCGPAGEFIVGQILLGSTSLTLAPLR